MALGLTIPNLVFIPLTDRVCDIFEHDLNSYMPIAAERIHLGVTEEHLSDTDPALQITQAVYPERYSPIETGVYQYDNELVLCLSTQIGCAMGCRFCDSTGPFKFFPDKPQKRFLRNLRGGEIIHQAIRAIEVARRHHFDENPLLFSFMGMGEPLENYDQLKYAVWALGLIFPTSRTTISTLCNKPSVVNELAEDITRGFFPTLVKLHFSLHAPNDKLRRNIMPAAAPLQKTVAAMISFMEITGLPVKANYMLIRDVNDQPKHEEELVTLLANTGIILKVSDFNSADLSLVVSPEKADTFAERIAAKGIPTCRFRSLGPDIHTRCGEFALPQLK